MDKSKCCNWPIDKNGCTRCGNKPLDTSTLGPIRIEPNQDAERARLVREAMAEIAIASRQNGNLELSQMWHDLSSFESDIILARFGRMLRF